MPRLNELASLLEGELSGGDINVTSLSVPQSQEPGSICLLSKADMLDSLQGAAAAYVVPPDFPGIAEKPLIRVKNTRLALIKLLEVFYPEAVKTPVISPKATLSDSVRLGQNVSIGDYVVIGQQVDIGDNTVIQAGVVVGDNVKIGSDCLIYPRVVLYANTEVRDGVIIHAGAVIGADGFGYVPGAEHTKIPHKGNVILEKNVEIGANTCIDRGTIGSTVIGEGTKIDNLVMVGHNVTIGRGCLIASQCGLSGSTSLGDYVTMGGQVGLADHIKISSFVSIAAKAGVSKDLKEKGAYGGIPAVPIKDWARQIAGIGQIADTRKRLINLEKKNTD